jgi:hypothetical protein
MARIKPRITLVILFQKGYLPSLLVGAFGGGRKSEFSVVGVFVL